MPLVFLWQRCRRSLLRAFAAILMLATGWAGAQGPSENQVKAAYVFHFVRYVEWPAKSFTSPTTPFSVCIGGREPFGGALSGIEGRQVQGRELRVRRGVAAEDLQSCQVLVVSDAEERRTGTWLKATPAGVLTVSESEGFIDAGGAIGLVTADERIQFDVNIEALNRAGLKASAHLLKVARVLTGMRRN